jgi:hypothetical protein
MEATTLACLRRAAKEANAKSLCSYSDRIGAFNRDALPGAFSSGRHLEESFAQVQMGSKAKDWPDFVRDAHSKRRQDPNAVE